MRRIQDIDIKNKKILLRVDFNVSLEKGDVKEKFKIKSCQKTLDYLVEKNCKVALLSWLGRPEGKINLDLSLGQIVDDAERILGYKIKFIPDCIGEKVKKTVDKLKTNEVALLENVRFYPEEGDVEAGTEFDDNFARKLADGFDIFVNDAISVSHRNQASVVGVAKHLPSYAGFQLQKEVEEFEKIKNNPRRPAVAVIGGAKIETKLPVIQFFEKNYDYILVGGKVANEAIDEKIYSPTKFNLIAGKNNNSEEFGVGVKFGEKVILPDDYVGERMDIGPKTIAKFKNIIHDAKTIVWNGPMGKFEEKKYSRGTQEIFEAIIESNAYTVVGGGETLEILEKNNAMDKISFVSTGGGAMLEYLGGEEMPGIEALN